MSESLGNPSSQQLTRRDFLKAVVATGVVAALSLLARRFFPRRSDSPRTPSTGDAMSRLPEIPVPPEYTGMPEYGQWANTLIALNLITGAPNYLALNQIDFFFKRIPPLSSPLYPLELPKTPAEYAQLIGQLYQHKATQQAVSVLLHVDKATPPTDRDLYRFYELVKPLFEMFPFAALNIPIELWHKPQGGRYFCLICNADRIGLTPEHLSLNYIRLGLAPADDDSLRTRSAFMVAAYHEIVGHGATNPYVLWGSGIPIPKILAYYTERNLLLIQFFVKLTLQPEDIRQKLLQQFFGIKEIFNGLRLYGPERKGLSPEQKELVLRRELAELFRISPPYFQEVIREIATERGIDIDYPNRGLPIVKPSFNERAWVDIYARLLGHILDIFKRAGIDRLKPPLTEAKLQETHRGISVAMAELYPRPFRTTTGGMLLIQGFTARISALLQTLVGHLDHYLVGPLQVPTGQDERLGTRLPTAPQHLTGYPKWMALPVELDIGAQYAAIKYLSGAQELAALSPQQAVLRANQRLLGISE